jgi:tetratricopeptide (TPR) repeat protein
MITHHNFKRWNTILGWASFLIAFIVYMLTLEPTASWWDCGEYISTAYKLQVGHPPGAPTFQLVGRFFSLLAFGNTANVAKMINMMSAFNSALTILFLFWTISLLARKLVKAGENGYSLNQVIMLFGSAFVGAMAYTFSDSFWFSASEGEVYAMSSAFTAITFWAILKWEVVAEEKHNLRWLIFIAFLIGLTVGVHLLNLLTVPAIVFVYYFKKYKPTRKGMAVAGLVSVFILFLLMYILIPGIVKLAGSFELFFVNSIGMPFNSGTIIYFALLIGLIVWGIKYTTQKNKSVLNTIILSFVFFLIGYSSFFILIIRSNANTPIDENSPEDAIGLLSYLNREQYGTYPLYYGQYYNAPVEDYNDGTPVYVKDKAKGEYIVTDDRKESEPVYDSRFTTIFPRMWSNQKSGHIKYYKEYGNIKGTPITVRKPDGSSETLYKPTFGENLRYFFTYQVGHMYLRYFMWNFAGRQNDNESQGEPENGNWISGFNFLDKGRLGDQSDLPISRENTAHNKYYLLPLILGLVGFFYHLRTSKNDTWVVLLLFVMTGLAIVVFLNQHPLQPRERDYAYAGSFYAFAIWIGLGVMGLIDLVQKKVKKNEVIIAGAVVAATFILVPGIMANQGWKDHDRSGKYAAHDFAVNYLKGCDKNSVLVTFGDNDTFPLWYVQEVEGYRTDVRVLNHMLASGHWYVQQMFSKVYESDPLPFTLKKEQYNNGVNNYIPIYEHPSLEGKYTELSELIGFVALDDDRSKMSVSGGRKINYFPSKKIRLTVDAKKCVENGIVPREMADKIVPYIEWDIKQNALFKNDLAVLDFLATNNWERALYTANPSSMSSFLDIDQYLHQEGMVYKFMPVRADNYYEGIGGVNPDKTYEVFMNCRWGNLNDPKVTVDRESDRNSRLPRQNYLRAAETFLSRGENEKAVELLDKCIYFFPDNKVQYDMMMIPFAEIYYGADEIEKANAIVSRLIDINADDLRYYNGLKAGFAERYYSASMDRNVRILRNLSQLAKMNGQNDLASRADEAIALMGK